MNNKDFINQIAGDLNLTAKSVQKMSTALINELADRMDDETTFTVQGFGSFEVKKKLERITVNPATKKRKLIPPKLVLSFKQSSILKEKINTPAGQEEGN